MTAYLDCNATTPLEPEVTEELLQFTAVEFGNAGSRSHDFGARARKRLERAREQVAAVVDGDATGVVFTSGATEANNIALLGLEHYGRDSGRTHIVSTQIEHKAILEPLDVLARRGFEVELVPPSADGRVDADEVASHVTDRTLLVSFMHANNETGVLQPVTELVERLGDSPAFLHIDAAQGFGKQLDPLTQDRIDLISVSAHKLYAPKGSGALIMRRRDGRWPPLEPLMFGGGQERGLRPGTAPVGLLAAFGLACELALAQAEKRAAANRAHLDGALAFADRLAAELNGAPDKLLGTGINLSVPGVDSEAAMLALKGTAAVSNGSACTSHDYSPSHVLQAMGLPTERAASALRISWSHLTADVDWLALEAALEPLIAIRPQQA